MAADFQGRQDCGSNRTGSRSGKKSLDAWNVLSQQSLCEEEPRRMRAGFILMNPVGDSLILCWLGERFTWWGHNLVHFWLGLISFTGKVDFVP